MEEEIFKPNQKVRIRPFGVGVSEVAGGIVRDVTSDRLYLSFPGRESSILRLTEGMRVHVEVIAPDAAYLFDSTVTGVGGLEIPIIAIERPGEVTRHQRRNFVRVKASLPITYRTDRPGLLAGEGPGHGITRDISGGGFLGVMPDLIRLPPEGTMFDLEIEFPGEPPPVRLVIKARGRVVRAWMEEIGEEKRPLVAVNFVDLPESDRRSIIRFVFRRQRELKSKGLL